MIFLRHGQKLAKFVRTLDGVGHCDDCRQMSAEKAAQGASK
jgi:hypothetical protein